MDFFIWISTFILLAIVGMVILLANQSEKNPRFRPVAKFAIFALIMMALGNKALEVAAVISDDTAKPENGAVSFGIMLLVCALAGLFLLDSFRVWVARFFPKPIPINEKPLSFGRFLPGASPMAAAPAYPYPYPSQSQYLPAVPSELEDRPVIYATQPPAYPAYAPQAQAQSARYELMGFRPESLVHALAAILILLFFGQNISSYFQEGGLSGIAEDLAVDYNALYSNFVMMVILSLMGVGLFIRRGARDTMRRLGLTGIGIKEIAVAVGSTFAVLVGLYAIVVVWVMIVGMDTFEQQSEASSALADSVNTMGMAFAIAFTAAVWEEIAFRGALQPIFGLAPTAIIFALIHIQYTLTPATLIILMVAVVLGFIRRYFNTTTAILVHFLYNFAQLALTVAVSEEAIILVRHIL